VVRDLSLAYYLIDQGEISAARTVLDIAAGELKPSTDEALKKELKALRARVGKR
jgi:hypothetical protein